LTARSRRMVDMTEQAETIAVEASVAPDELFTMREV
jgi:hypothetical protein